MACRLRHALLWFNQLEGCIQTSLSMYQNIQIIFQFKLLHRRLSTNEFLKKNSFRQDDLCTFCKDEKESLIHLFWSCRVSRSFWQFFQDWLDKNHLSLEANIPFSPALVLGLKTDCISNTQQYFYFLVARYYIWICKFREKIPKIEGFPFFLSCLDGSAKTLP